MEFRQDLFQFRWAVCIDGYREMTSGEDYYGPLDYLEPISTNFRWYEPATDYPDLFRKFAGMPNTEKAAKAFVAEFGSLGLERHGAETGQNLRGFLQFHKNFKRAIKNLDKGNVQKAGSLFNFPGIRPKLTMGVDYEIPERVRFYVIPESLVDFMGFQLATEMSGGISWRNCGNPRCDKRFMIASGRGAITGLGVGTIRKETCGKPACRKALTRLRARERKDKTDG